MYCIVELLSVATYFSWSFGHTEIHAITQVKDICLSPLTSEYWPIPAHHSHLKFGLLIPVSLIGPKGP